MSVTAPLNAALRRVPIWLLYILAVIPPVWLFVQGLNGRLGVDPVKAMEHQMGLWGLQILIAVLAITPLRTHLGINAIRFRRALGLIGFFYIVLHLLVWLVLDVQIPRQILGDIYKRPYITIGMAALVLMVPLALTSNNLALRKLGPRRWRRLHRATYVILLLGAVHYVMVVRGWQLQPLIYLALVVILLLLRVIPPPKRRLA